MKIPLKIQLETERTMLLEVIETLEDARRRHRLHTNTAVSLQRAIATVDTVVGRLRRAQVASNREQTDESTSPYAAYTTPGPGRHR